MVKVFICSLNVDVCYIIITVYCMDVKINIDDNASYRQTELFKLRDYSQEDPNEVEASQYNLNYIKLDGSIGCVGRWLISLVIVTHSWCV